MRTKPMKSEILWRTSMINNESSNQSDDESDHEIKPKRNKKVWKGPERDPGEVRMKTRCGKLYRQDGIKMRPSIRNNRERPRYNQEYLKRKKPKDNALKNRCAMRRKQKMHMLKGYLNEIIKLKEFKQKSSNKIESKYNLAFQQIGSDRKVEYGNNKAILIARFMEQIKHNVRNKGVSFIQQYYLNKGLKIFKEDGDKAAMGELEELVQRNCWDPIHVEEMNDLERKRAQDAMMLLAEKNTGEIKGRCVYKGNGTREWLSREDTSSPTASLEAIMTTCVID